MGAAQPANTTIQVFQRLRTIRNNGRHLSIKHLTTPFDTVLVPAPGEEVQVVETRDAAGTYTAGKTDAFRYGHPVCVMPRHMATLAELYAGTSGLDFPVRLIGNPREIQVQKAPAHVTDDLWANARAVTPGTAFVCTGAAPSVGCA